MKNIHFFMSLISYTASIFICAQSAPETPSNDSEEMNEVIVKLLSDPGASLGGDR